MLGVMSRQQLGLEYLTSEKTNDSSEANLRHREHAFNELFPRRWRFSRCSQMQYNADESEEKCPTRRGQEHEFELWLESRKW